MGKLISNKASSDRRTFSNRYATVHDTNKTTQKGNLIYRLQSLTKEERDIIRPNALGYII